MNAEHRLARLVGAVAVALALAVFWGASTRAGEEDQVIPLGPIEVTAPWPLIPPRPTKLTKPPYPEGARRNQEQGTVSLVVRVLANGSVGDVSVKQSSGARALDEAAVAEARGWQFAPGTRGPKAVDALVEIPVRFQLVE